jgi:hypothetical protein
MGAGHGATLRATTREMITLARGYPLSAAAWASSLHAILEVLQPRPYHPAMSGPSRSAALLVGVFCLIPLLNFPGAFLADRTLFLRDIAMVWAPQVESVVQQVGRGEFPAFDMKRGFGQPLFADPRAEVLYPPSWIHWILPVDRSYALFAGLHLVIAALGAARLARRLVPDASLLAQATAGFAFAASGPVVSLVSHWHHLAAAAWMPWILEKAATRDGEPTPWLGLSALVALQVLAGSPDYTFTTFVLCGLLMLIRTGRPGRPQLKVMAALVLGLSLSAVQLLPSLVFAREAAREKFPIGWALSPLHPALTLETVVPFRAETWPLRPEARGTLLNNGQVWMFSHYLGLSVWALALAGLIRKDAGVRFAAGAVILGLVLALGVRNETLQALVGQLPLVSGLRFPTKHLVASSLGLSLLAASGVMTPSPWPARLKRGIAALVVATLGATAVLFIVSTKPGVAFEPAALVHPLIAIAVVGALLILRSRSERWIALIPALVAVDLLSAHRNINPTTPSSIFRDRPPLTRMIPEGSRLYVSDYSSQARHAPIRLPPGPPYRLRNAPAGFAHPESLALAALWYMNPPSATRLGYFGSFELDVLDFYRRPLQQSVESFVTSRDPRFIVERLRRASVEYVVTMDAPHLWSALPLIHEEAPFFEQPVRVYKVPGAWPRARFETAQGDLEPGAPRVVEATDGRIRIEAAAPHRTRIVFAVANDRGWHASVDGSEVPISDSVLAFLSVPLDAGSHVVELTYRPPLILPGVAISALSLLVALFLTSRKGVRPSTVSAP